jgi:glycosyltransferase involved in cell wall biosynthesis
MPAFSTESGASDPLFTNGDGERPLSWPDSVGLVHDWLPVYAGAERVLEQMIQVCPSSEVYSLIDFVPEDQRAFLQDKEVETSFIQRLPFAKRAYRYYLPFAPFAIEQFDLSDHDVVVSSSYAVAKGALTRSDQVHVSYVHSPIRYAWDLYHDYLEAEGMGERLRNLLARPILHYMRLYDVSTAPRVDVFVANSQHVARRIWKRYRRRAHVVYPPVDISRFSVQHDKEDYFLTMSRLVSYKRMDLLVRAFNEMPGKQLYVIGDGPERDRLERLAGPNVEVLGYQPDEAVAHYMENAQAFVFAAEEDFGIVPVEAQACGTPVIAYGRGGATETVVEGKTGLFFESQDVAAVRTAVSEFEELRPQLDAEAIRAHAEQFDVSAFRTAFSRLIRSAYADFWSGERPGVASMPSEPPDEFVSLDHTEPLS